MQELARVVLHVFRHLKEYEMTGTTGLLKQSAISLAALRIFLRDIPLFRMRDLDILIKRLGVAYVSTAPVCCNCSAGYLIGTIRFY